MGAGLKVLCAVLIIYLMFKAIGFSKVWSWEFRRPAGVTVPETPKQTSASGIKPWRFRDTQVIPLARYKIRARVIMVSNFGLGAESGLSRFDFVLGWGPMSDTRNLKQISFSHGYRQAMWTAENPPLPWNVLNEHACNLHAIPADDGIDRTLGKLGTDDIVIFEGYLVQTESSDGIWTSSLSRQDTGDGACEVMWIEKVKIE